MHSIAIAAVRRDCNCAGQTARTRRLVRCFAVEQDPRKRGLDVAIEKFAANDKADSDRLDAAKRIGGRDEQSSGAPIAERSRLCRHPRIEHAVAIGVDAVFELQVDDVRGERIRRVAAQQIGGAKNVGDDVVTNDLSVFARTEIDEPCG